MTAHTAHLYIHTPVPLFKARVNMASASYPIMQLTYDGVTLGAHTDIPFDATLTLGTSEGADDLGRVRIQKPVHTADTIYIARSSLGVEDGTLDVQDNAYITVWDDFRVWAKLPYFDLEDLEAGNDYKDGDIPVGTFNVNIPPVANAGPPWAGTIDSVTGLITVTFPQDGINNSFAMADGASLSSYSWDVADGTITVGTSASSVITATFPAGFRHVSLTVTDSNGVSHTARTPVLAVDPANDVRIKHWKGSQRLTITGVSLDLDIFDELSRESYPDGTLVLLWWDEPLSAGDRTHIKFYGWLDDEQWSVGRSKTGLTKTTKLHCVDVAGRLAKLPGFPQALSRTETESPWSYMPSLDMSKSLHYLLFWHSTALNVVDFILPVDGGDYDAMRLDASGATLLQQVASQAEKLVPDHYLTCNSRGQMNFLRDWRLDDVGDRPAVYHTITEDNWNNLQGGYIRQPRVHVLRSGAILSSTAWVGDGAGNDTLPLVFSIAPGGAGAFGQGTSEQAENEGLALSQEALNKAEGHRYAMLNARHQPFNFQDPSGDQFWLYEPGLLRRIQLNIGADKAAQRGLDFTEAAGLVTEVQVQYEVDKKGTRINPSATWEKETSGYPALTFIPETGETIFENEAPVITLLGDNPLLWYHGNEFVDPGATANDPEEGDLTDKIIIGGTVDHLTAGDYIITYNVFDRWGNPAIQVSRTVTVAMPWNKTGIVAAYEPIYANTLSESYVNLANPGTFDCVPRGVVEPTLSGGWVWTGVDFQGLDTGIEPDSGWSAIARFDSIPFSTSVVTSPVFQAHGSQQGGLSTFWGANPAYWSSGGMRTYRAGPFPITEVLGAVTEGVIAMAGQQGYLNGVPDGGPTTGFYTTPTQNPLTIGADAVPASNITFIGRITHLYIFNRTLTAQEVAEISEAIA